MGRLRRALIVGDDPLFRSELRAVLERTYDVVGETDDRADALARAAVCEAELIVTDILRKPHEPGAGMAADRPLALLLVVDPERSHVGARHSGVRAYVRSASELAELTELLLVLAGTGPSVE